MKTRLTLILSFALLALPAAASAHQRYYVPKHHQACKASFKREVVKIRERRHGKLVRRHHKVVIVRQVRCVYVAPKKTTKPTTTLPPVSTGAPTQGFPTVRAGIDPSFTQDANDNLRVTWDYSTSSSSGSLPDGTLSLAVSEPGKTGNSGGCSMNVGLQVTGGQCTVELSRYGNWSVTVSYAGSDAQVAPATSTDTEDIEPLPTTVSKTWGTDAPSNTPSVSATVIGSQAEVQVTDSNYEGATSLQVSDQNGDTCTATITGTQAACQMAVGATPSRFLIAYPGGSSTRSTQAVPPGGTRQVTTTWPAQSVPVTNPTVTVQQATVEECGGSITGINPSPWANNAGTCTAGNPVAWQNPVDIGTTGTVNLDAVAYGSLTNDQDPTHGDGMVSGYLSYNVTGGTEGTDYTATDNQGSSPDNTQDCSKVLTQQYLGGDPSDPANYGPDGPFGSCGLHFLTPGTYTVTVSYTSEDANYASVPNEDSITINVD